MLTHMLVQYLVGPCCLRRNPDAVQVELGALVTDEASGKERDVDVTVTVRDDSGDSWAFKAFEVKDEKSSLDVNVVEQLCGKLNDMPSITHRAIVSSSGFINGAKRKAEHHGVDLYTLENGQIQLSLNSPGLDLRGCRRTPFPLVVNFLSG
jgi:Restriction endonuclease